MLIDEVLAEPLPDYIIERDTLRSRLDTCPKYFLEDSVRRYISNHPDIEYYHPSPDDVFWLEFSLPINAGDKGGLLCIDPRDVYNTDEILLYSVTRRSGGTPMISHPLWFDTVTMEAFGDEEWAGRHDFIELMVVMTMGFLTTINTVPVEQKKSDLTKLNKSRIKSGKSPLQEYSTLYLHKGASQSRNGTGTGSKKMKHFVRTFTRVRNGQPELVRAHWRGDEALGTLFPRRRVAA